MDISVLYEDDNLLVINKPPGTVVNRAQSVKTETIQDWIEKRPSWNPKATTENHDSEFDINQEFISRSGIVHRIDKETSGILVTAKTAENFRLLKQQFLERTVKKTYRAIVHERMPSQEGDIQAPIDRLPWNKELFGVVPSGKESLTHYKVLKTYEKKVKNKTEYYQLIECFPKTGRTHQIRVHVKYLNRPILGDYLYAGRKTARNDRTWVPRVMLHAYSISFVHPKTNELLTLQAPIPDDMDHVLNTLQSVEK